jgi:succinate dehydrogenase/fumarate reductase flavoprotein subunit
MKETIEIKPASVTKVQLNTMFSLIEQSLNLTLSVKGRRAARKDIDRYLLRNENDINKTITYFQDYKQRLKNLYIGYSEEAFNNVINQLYK